MMDISIFYNEKTWILLNAPHLVTAKILNWFDTGLTVNLYKIEDSFIGFNADSTVYHMINQFK